MTFIEGASGQNDGLGVLREKRYYLYYKDLTRTETEIEQDGKRRKEVATRYLHPAESRKVYFDSINRNGSLGVDSRFTLVKRSDGTGDLIFTDIPENDKVNDEEYSIKEIPVYVIEGMPLPRNKDAVPIFDVEAIRSSWEPVGKIDNIHNFFDHFHEGQSQELQIGLSIGIGVDRPPKPHSRNRL